MFTYLRICIFLYFYEFDLVNLDLDNGSIKLQKANNKLAALILYLYNCEYKFVYFYLSICVFG